MPDTNFRELVDKVVTTTKELALAQMVDGWLPSKTENKTDKAENDQQKAIDALMEAIEKLNDAHITLIDFMV